ncbi:uncharacterized protein [Venturia canescens]|uniref:uncharacterized protein isoform X1 n=1 Tax=Venturia canescens TaxID=32260 RepID=UPI001C9BC9B5|nr:uncharacterized protein LOC122418607 isoform X1 [Venturia canescens]
MLKKLCIVSLQQSDAGVYQCRLEDTASAPYFVHVASVKAEKTRLVFSLWSPWSSCSTCGKVGQRIRYGYCTISLINSKEQIDENYERDSGETEMEKRSEKGEMSSEVEKHNGKRSEDQANTETANETTTNRFEETSTLGGTYEAEEAEDQKSPEELKILAESVLRVYRNRLPCRSPQTPKDIQNIKQIRSRKTEIMKGLCKIKCLKDTVFEIRDKSGNIIESANNSAGVFSMLQGLPEPRPAIERTTLYRKHGKSTELVCPGNLNEDIPVIWQIGTKVLVPSEIEKTTQGRITMDAQRRIVIKKLRFVDANIYSCWQRGELAGTIRLQVTTEVELKVDHRIFMIGAIVIVTVLLRIFWKAFRGRKRFTIH